MKKFLSGVSSLRIVIHLHRLFNGKLRDVIDFLFIPFYIICYPFILLFRVKDNRNFKYKLGICLIIKNESSYIKEWADYYINLGAEQLYIFDNDSNDNVIDILNPYIEKGIVKYHKIHGKGRQLDAYTLCCKKYKKECEYVAFLDIDEFIYLDPNTRLINIIDEHFNKFKDAGALALNWLIFGSSNNEFKENKLVIERFVYRSETDFEKNHHIKIIANPRRVCVFRNPHFAYFYNGYKVYSLNGEVVEGAFTKTVEDRIRINHYFCKSKEEYLAKKNKGFADKLGEREMNDFIIHDKNDIFDDSMSAYVKILKGNNR